MCGDKNYEDKNEVANGELRAAGKECLLCTDGCGGVYSFSIVHKGGQASEEIKSQEYVQERIFWEDSCPKPRHMVRAA